MNTQLLCTFVAEEKLQESLEAIVRSYDIAFDSIYVLENTDSPGNLCLTYNINSNVPPIYPIPASTISLHRKKQSNTLYSINALNKFVQLNNNGKIDHKFPVPWNEVRNCILVTTYDELRKIPTKVKRIVKTNEI